jgi:hypothetical protein
VNVLGDCAKADGEISTVAAAAASAAAEQVLMSLIVSLLTNFD